MQKTPSFYVLTGICSMQRDLGVTYSKKKNKRLNIIPEGRTPDSAGGCFVSVKMVLIVPSKFKILTQVILLNSTC